MQTRQRRWKWTQTRRPGEESRRRSRQRRRRASRRPATRPRPTRRRRGPRAAWCSGRSCAIGSAWVPRRSWLAGARAAAGGSGGLRCAARWNGARRRGCGRTGPGGKRGGSGGRWWRWRWQWWRRVLPRLVASRVAQRRCVTPAALATPPPGGRARPCAGAADARAPQRASRFAPPPPPLLRLPAAANGAGASRAPRLRRAARRATSVAAASSGARAFYPRGRAAHAGRAHCTRKRRRRPRRRAPASASVRWATLHVVSRAACVSPASLPATSAATSAERARACRASRCSSSVASPSSCRATHTATSAPRDAHPDRAAGRRRSRTTVCLAAPGCSLSWRARTAASSTSRRPWLRARAPAPPR